MQRIRSVVFMAYFAASILITSIIAAPVVLFASHLARPVAQIWARATLRVLKILTGISYRIEGAENIPAGGAIVAANHQSQWETIALYALLPKPVVIMKKELLRIPLYGWWMQRVGNITVDRKGGAKALRALQAQAAQRIGQGEQIVVFPEGTRSPVGGRMPFHSGVAGIYTNSEASCIPVAHNSGQYWRFPGITKMPGEITLRFLPPLVPGFNRKAFLDRLQTQIENARPDLTPPNNNQTDDMEKSDD
jgi:1-acyl-sn-glycerol-3-phosphate acyltransferase